MATTADIDAEARIPEPQLSSHCLDRYDERTPAGTVSPEAALQAAIPDDGIAEHPRFGDASDDYPDPDRVWIHTDYADGEWYTIVFIDVRGTAVTCWRGDRGVVYPAIAAYLVVRGLGGLIS